MSGNGPGAKADANLIPFEDRLRYTHVVRLIIAAVVVVAWFTGAAPSGLSTAMVAALTASYLAATTVTLVGDRLPRSVGITIFGSALLLDGLYLATVTYAVGGFAAPLMVLVLIHVVSTTLLASFRTGLKLALWHSLLVGAVFQVQEGGFLPDAPRPSATLATIVVAGLWLATLITASAGSANERELRRRNYDLRALTRLGVTMEQTTDPDAIANAIVGAVSSDFGIDSVALVAAASGEPVLVAGVGIRQSSQPFRPAVDALVADTLLTGTTRRIASPDVSTNPWLASIMPDARHVVLVPLHAEGRTLGVLVFEYKAGTNSRIERRIVEMVEQFVAHGALALQNAWLLSRIGALAATDGLTGIANRRTFDFVLTREMQRANVSGAPMSLLLVDIDHFKRHNDEHGHQMGDRTLRAVAQTLAKNGRQNDVAARYGGEEFAVILPGADSAAALEKADRLRLLVAALPDPAVTISVGLATYPFHGMSSADLIKAADGALYESKHEGRNRVTVANLYGAIGAHSVEAVLPLQALPSDERREVY